MKTRGIFDEDFVNYKKPAMFICAADCNFKCCHEAGIPESICQNSSMTKSQIIDVPTDEILRRYRDNPITESVVVAGLEPMIQFNEVLDLLQNLRQFTDDDFVIYTGYDWYEIRPEIQELAAYKNVIVKFGRYIPNDHSVNDSVLGVVLASSNQYGMRIS